MNHAAIVRQYLKDRTRSHIPRLGYPFVTISREAGAGGRTLAVEIVKQVEDRLPPGINKGWEVFDHELCALLSEDPHLKMSFESLLAEQYRSEARQFLYEMISGRAEQYTAYKKIFEVMRLLATLGKVVLVGRAGNCVTADMPTGVRVRLVAGLPTRIRRMMKLLNIGEEQASRKIRDQDRDRARLTQDFFTKDINDPVHYDAVFNTDALAIADIATLVVDMVDQKMERYGAPPEPVSETTM
jgi:cytidylate kinase